MNALLGRWLSASMMAWALLLTGCASTLDASTKATIKTVSVDVALSDELVVAKPGAGMLLLVAGPLGTLGINDADVTKVYAGIVARNVDVPGEVRRAAVSTLERRGYRVVEAPQVADAKLTIKGNYGLGLVGLLGDDRGAATTLRGELIRTADGASLWRHGALGMKADPALRSKLRVAPFDQWFKDDALVREQHTWAAKASVDDLLQGL